MSKKKNLDAPGSTGVAGKPQVGTWLTNLAKHESMYDCLWLIKIGQPKMTTAYGVFELMEMGMVGIYVA